MAATLPTSETWPVFSPKNRTDHRVKVMQCYGCGSDEHLIGSRKFALGGVREHTRKKLMNGIPAVRVVHEFVQGMEGAAEHDDDGDWYGHGVDPPSSGAADQALMDLEKFVLLGRGDLITTNFIRSSEAEEDSAVFTSHGLSPFQSNSSSGTTVEDGLFQEQRRGYFTPPPSPTQKREGQARKL